jgi:hypothetical protein
MIIMPETEIWKQFFRRYNRNPLNWRIYSGISDTGNLQLLINSPNYRWLIERDSAFSDRPGIGGMVEECIVPKLDLEQSGYRPVPGKIMKHMIALMEEGKDYAEAAKIIESAMRCEPITFEEIGRIRPRAIMSGPIMLSPRPIQTVVGGQLELDAKLEAELEKLKKRRIASYVG